MQLKIMFSKQQLEDTKCGLLYSYQKLPLFFAFKIIGEKLSRNLHLSAIKLMYKNGLVGSHISIFIK
jgi:hypothetical protein